MGYSVTKRHLFPTLHHYIEKTGQIMMMQHKQGTWILLATILGSSMVFIDSSIVNVALPVLQADLAAPMSSVQWVVEVYILFLAALMLVGGALGDLWGRKRTFAIGIILFVLSSVWCGLAPNISQ